nr:MAG TPA: hypothetical protein [Caudoviricetes sp.]
MVKNTILFLSKISYNNNTKRNQNFSWQAT